MISKISYYIRIKEPLGWVCVNIMKIIEGSFWEFFKYTKEEVYLLWEKK